MQHTKTCNFNIIETSDPFSPEPLNENTRSVEAQLASVRGEFAAADAGQAAQLSALTGRVGALEQGRLVYKLDTYKGTGSSPTRLEFDFKPLLVIVDDPTGPVYGGRVWLRGITHGTSGQHESGLYRYVTLTWEDRAVEWVTFGVVDSDEYRLNAVGVTYRYFALGITE